MGPPSIAPSVQYRLLSVVGAILNPLFILLHETKYCALVGEWQTQTSMVERRDFLVSFNLLPG